MRQQTLCLVMAILAAGLVLTSCSQATPAQPTTAPVAPAATQPTIAPVAAQPTAAPSPAQPTAAPAAKAAAPAPTAVKAAGYPTQGKTITIINPAAAGGGTDVGLRLLSPLWEKELGTTLTPVYMPGGGHQLGLTAVLKAQPGGYTVGICALPTAAFLYLDPQRQAEFARKDFLLLANYAFTPQMLAVSSASPYKTLKDLVDAARAKPATIMVADVGLMTTTHMATMMLESQSGVRFRSVHFGGGGEAVAALLGGHVDAFVAAIANVAAQASSGEIRILGVMDKERDAGWPNIPTLEEQGFKVNIGSYHGVVTAQGAPPEVVDTWATITKKALASPDIEKKFRDGGLTPRFLDPNQYAKLWDEMEGYVKDALARGPEG